MDIRYSTVTFNLVSLTGQRREEPVKRTDRFPDRRPTGSMYCLRRTISVGLLQLHRPAYGATMFSVAVATPVTTTLSTDALHVPTLEVVCVTDEDAVVVK